MRPSILLPALLLLCLFGCDYSPVGESYSESDALPYRVLKRSDGSNVLEVRIPAPYDWGDFNDALHQPDSTPSGQAKGTWWRQTFLHATGNWSTHEEFWLGWWVLDAYQIDRGNQKLPVPLETDGIDALYQVFASDTMKGHRFTTYIPPDESSQWTTAVSGTAQDSMFGVFFRVWPSDSLVVAQPIAGGSAIQAGILDGDRILSVDGRPGRSAIAYMRDSVGVNSVQFIVRHASKSTPDTLHIARRPGTAPSAFGDTLPGRVGYIRLSQFAGGDATKGVTSSDEQFRAAAEWIGTRSSGPWILDLRSNGGGYVEVARRIASMLVPPGSSLVRETSRGPTDPKLEGVVTTSILTDSATLPRVLSGRSIRVLQDTFSASATEILISALRTNLGATVKTYGDCSFGKGIGQITIQSPLGAFYKVTSLHVDPIDGPSYNRIGIPADFPTAYGDSTVARAWNDARAAGAGGRALAGTPNSVPDFSALEWNRRESTPSRVPEEPAIPLKDLFRR